MFVWSSPSIASETSLSVLTEPLRLTFDARLPHPSVLLERLLARMTSSGAVEKLVLRIDRSEGALDPGEKGSEPIDDDRVRSKLSDC